MKLDWIYSDSNIRWLRSLNMGGDAYLLSFPGGTCNMRRFLNDFLIKHN